MPARLVGLGCQPRSRAAADDASPVRVIQRRHRATRTCASASSPATAWVIPNQSETQAPRADPSPPARSSSTHRLTPLRVTPEGSCVGADDVERLAFDRAPLMRFLSPSAHAGRDALIRGGSYDSSRVRLDRCRPRINPASVFSWSWTRAQWQTDPTPTPPLRFFAIWSRRLNRQDSRSKAASLEGGGRVGGGLAPIVAGSFIVAALLRQLDESRGK